TETESKPTTTPTTPMATTSKGGHKAQTQCLDVCHKTTSFIDRISVHILECLTSGKALPDGFEVLAHDFLDICQILFSIEAGLSEYNRTGQRFPPELITELNLKFRVTQADFQMLDQMLGKVLGHSSGMKRAWGRMFGDQDIKKLTSALSKTRESLRMSSLVFQWSLGSDKVEREMGIGYTGLAAALDRMDHKAGNGNGSRNGNGHNNGNNNGNGSGRAGSVRSAGHNGIQHQMPAVTPYEVADDQNSFQQQQQFYQQNQQQQQQQQQQQFQQAPSWTNRSSSIQHKELPGRPGLGYGNDSGIRMPSSPVILTTSTPGSANEWQYSAMNDSHDRASANDDARSQMTGITESSIFQEDISHLDIGPGKAVRHKVEPANMPRIYARNSTDSDTSNLKAHLMSAIRGKNHKVVEQLLNRGVSPNTGPHVHALKEAILVHDEEIIRLLLVYGADANEPDRDGVTPLFAAVTQSFLGAATILLKYGADPNLVAGPDLESPLSHAVMANMVGMSHLLLTYNGDENTITGTGNTLLISAIKKKTPKKFIDCLLDYGSEPNAKSREGVTALFEAIQVGRADIVTSLLDHGADANLPGPKHMLWPATHQAPCLQVLLAHGADPKKAPGIMELAVSFNNIESVRLLLKAGVNPDTKKDGIYTPLCTAIRDDRESILRLLLASGASPGVMAGEYPIFKCITHKRLHFLPVLVEAGADLNTPKGIVETAVTYKNMEALNWLLDQGLNPNDKGVKGASPLTSAIREGRYDMVDLLLLRGADPNMRGQDWPICMAVRNPLILKRLLSEISEPRAFKGVMEMAVSANQLDSMKLLLAAGISVEDKNGGVFSPLTTALREDRREIVRYLLTDGGADVNAPGEHLPIVKALRRYHGEDTEMMKLLLDHGADPNKIYRGWNGIMQAVENGDLDVLEILNKKAGFDLEVKDEMGKTVVEMAASRGWDEAVQILRDGDIRLRK
ncbi:Ankyrin, partial [Lachnellula subtilissima]